MRAGRCFALALVVVTSCTGCAGAPPPRPAAQGEKTITPQERERATCEGGDPLPSGVASADEHTLRRPRATPRGHASPSLLAAPPVDTPPAPRTVDDLGPITRITLKGFLRVPPEKIRAAISLHEGDRPTTEALRRDVKALYATGLFDAIMVDFDESGSQVELIYIVQERPERGEVYFSGAESLTPAALKEIAALGDHPSHAAVAGAAARIKARYAEEGQRNAEVVPRLRERKGQVDICFRISEGVAVKIDRLVFQGNAAVSEADLKAVMDTDHGKVNAEGGVYREDRFEIDEMRQLALYYDRGYILAIIDPPKVVSSEDKARLTVTVGVHEGPLYRVGVIGVEGDLVADLPRYAALLQSKTGDVFNRSRMVEDIERIRALHKEAGQPFIEVTPKTELDTAHAVVNVTFGIARQKVIQ